MLSAFHLLYGNMYLYLAEFVWPEATTLPILIFSRMQCLSLRNQTGSNTEHQNMGSDVNGYGSHGVQMMNPKWKVNTNPLD